MNEQEMDKRCTYVVFLRTKEDVHKFVSRFAHPDGWDIPWMERHATSLDGMAVYLNFWGGEWLGNGWDNASVGMRHLEDPLRGPFCGPGGYQKFTFQETQIAPSKLEETIILEESL